MISVVCFLLRLVFLIVQSLANSIKVNAVTVESLCVNLMEKRNIFVRPENLCEPARDDAPVDGGDVRSQGPVFGQEGGAFADPGQDFVEARAGFQRPPQVDALGGGQKLDAQPTTQTLTTKVLP